MIGDPRCDHCYGSGHIKKCGPDGRMIFTRCNLTVQYDIRCIPVDLTVWDDLDDGTNPVVNTPISRHR